METEQWTSMLEACNDIINDEIEQIQAKVISILLRVEMIGLHEIENVYVSHFNQEISPKVSKYGSLVDLLRESRDIPIFMDEKKLCIDHVKFDQWIWNLVSSKKYDMAQLAFGFSHDFFMPGEKIAKIEVIPDLINYHGSLEKFVDVKIVSAINSSKVYVTLKYRDQAYQVMMYSLNYFMRNNHSTSFIPRQICDVKLYCTYYHDNVYYRARTTQFNNDGTIWVKLIDCGIDVLATESELRMLPREFAALERQSFCISLQGIQAVNEDSKSSIARELIVFSRPDYWIQCYLFPKIDGKTHAAVLVDKNKEMPLCLNDHLVQRKLAAPISNL